MMMRMNNLTEALSYIKSFQGKVVIDVGCGTGDLVREITLKGARVMGIDQADMIGKARQREKAGNETYLSGKAEDLPLKDSFADLVTFFASLHHVPEAMMERALREARRVLRNGGLVVCLEPVGVEGSYFELIRLVEDERDIQAAAYRAIRSAPSFNLLNQKEYRVYFERSYEDFLKLNETFIEDEYLKNQLARKAGEINRRFSLEAGVEFRDFRFRSICRVNILKRG